MHDSVVVPKTPFAFFRFASKKHRFWMWSAIGLVVLASALSQSTSYFFKLIIDAVERGDSSSALLWGLLFPVAVFLVQILYRMSGYAGAQWTTGAYKTGYDGLTHYVLQHSHSYFTNRFAGSVANKISNVVGAINETIPDFLWGQLSALVSFLVTFIFISTVDTTAGWLFVVLIITLIVVNQLIGKQKVILSKQSAEAGSVLQGRLVDVLTNASTVRQYVNSQFEYKTIEDLSLDKQDISLKNWLYTERMLLINSGILFIFLFWYFLDFSDQME
jgi:ATP-binding cassette, subfamily B, bacterial